MNLKAIQAIVREHLAMDRDPSAQEIEELRASLQRKSQHGTLDDQGEILMIRLDIAQPETTVRSRER